MDISNLATKDNSENGVWVQVEAYGQKWPFELKILGIDSDAVQKYNRDKIRSEVFAKYSSGKITEMSDSDYREVENLSDGGVIVRIAGIRGYRYADEDKKRRSPIKDDKVTLFGREIGADTESLQFLIDHIPAVKDFVLEKSKGRENFLAERRKN
jgi:hypothetical protein